MLLLTYLLVLLQALGAGIGALMAVWAELAYIRAARDGSIDDAEAAHLRHIARGLRYGMLLVLLSSFGLVVLSYVAQSMVPPALQSSYWTLMILSLVVIVVSWALSRKHVSFALGSAVLFAGWWSLVFLATGQIPPLAFGASVGFFVVVVGVFYAMLRYVRFAAVRV
jgi:hypothetical protein